MFNIEDFRDLLGPKMTCRLVSTGIPSVPILTRLEKKNKLQPMKKRNIFDGTGQEHLQIQPQHPANPAQIPDVKG